MTPMFIIEGIEYSFMIKTKLTWHEAMFGKWPDGWRLPSKQELLKLFYSETSSHVDEWYWTHNILDGENMSCCVNLYTGNEYYFECQQKKCVRLVRDNNIENIKELRDFGWALRKMKEGYRVRRKTWRNNSSNLALMSTPFRHVVKFDMEDFVEPWLTFSLDIVKDDWEIK
jgi:hypothetical protein